MKDLWVDKHSPKSFDEYTFQNEHHRQQITSWINDKSIPNLLLHGPAGTGKTACAKLLIKSLDINDFDVMIVNGSNEGRQIEWLRDKLEAFCQSMPFGEMRIVLIDEAEYLNPTSVQPALRHMQELYSSSVRFILTANYPSRIIPALHSRMQSIAVEKSDINEYTAKMAEILIAEDIKFDLDTLDSYVNAYYPDFRKCINTLQLNSQNGVLVSPLDVRGSDDYKLKMVELFKKGNITAARKLLCENALAEEMESIYRWCYEHLEYFGSTPEKQDNAVLIIKKSLVDHTICADPEINLADCMIRLSRNAED